MQGPPPARGWTRRRWVRGAPVAAWAGLAVSAAWTPPVQARPAQAGEVIAWPAIADLDGRALATAYGPGAPVVLVFWATWCAFCKRHNPRIEQLHRSAGGKGLRVLGVNIDADAAAVRRYMATHGLSFPMVLDSGALRARFTERRILPMTCTVDRDGRLLQCIPGEMSEEDVMDLARLVQPSPR